MTPFDEGLVTAGSSLNEDHNPYAEGTNSHSEWLRGYNDYKGPSALGGPNDGSDHD